MILPSKNITLVKILKQICRKVQLTNGCPKPTPKSSKDKIAGILFSTMAHAHMQGATEISRLELLSWKAAKSIAA